MLTRATKHCGRGFSPQCRDGSKFLETKTRAPAPAYAGGVFAAIGGQNLNGVAWLHVFSPKKRAAIAATELSKITLLRMLAARGRHCAGAARERGAVVGACRKFAKSLERRRSAATAPKAAQVSKIIGDFVETPCQGAVWRKGSR